MARDHADSERADVERAAALLQAGGLVVFPTETVYGLGADATNVNAIRRIFAVKGRPHHHPLILHVASTDALDRWASAVPPAARTLAAEFWPGPLTLVVRRSALVPDDVTGGRDTVGLRMPAHRTAIALLKLFGGAVAAPSANRFGRVSPTTADHVRADLGTDVDLILDGGPSAIGVESTIIELIDEPVLLRPGGLALERIEEVLGREVRRDVAGVSRAPGMLESHYAPRCRVEIVDTSRATARREELAAEGLAVDVWRPGPDDRRTAHELYRELRAADDNGLDVLLAVLPEEQGLGAAVADRLRKAAGPRSIE
jgi:L-threonylcarbamoyladenylate synthase